MNTDTKQKILDAARLTVQNRGYSGLSFRDLASDVGIKSASIHHYFPTKGDLGALLARNYTADFLAYLDSLLADATAPDDCIRKYTDVFRVTLLNENRMCMGAILAAERTDLPDEVKAEVVAFTEMNVGWLMRVLSLRRGAKALGEAALRQRAIAIFAAVEGAQLMSRARDDIAVYDEIIEAYRAAGLLP